MANADPIMVWGRENLHKTEAKDDGWKESPLLAAEDVTAGVVVDASDKNESLRRGDCVCKEEEEEEEEKPGDL
jgi:hypothetical protein